jgi:hypothetical protein
MFGPKPAANYGQELLNSLDLPVLLDMPQC